MSNPHFIQHNLIDDCAVAVMEGISGGKQGEIWIMENDATVQTPVNSDIPIGHKLAVKDMPAGQDIIKYGHVIGKLISPVKKGDHIHVHNLKTKRW